MNLRLIVAWLACAGVDGASSQRDGGHFLKKAPYARVELVSAKASTRGDSHDGEDTSMDSATNVQNFGPEGCVSVWRSPESHCVVRTQCQEDAIAAFEVSLICENGEDGRTRHVFGKGSFDSEEEFDTLIVCDVCEPDVKANFLVGPAPAAAPAAVPAKALPPPVTLPTRATTKEELNQSVEELVDQVQDLKNMMYAASNQVVNLRTKLSQASSAPAAAPVVPASFAVAAKPAPVQAFAMHRTLTHGEGHRRSLTHRREGRHRRHHSQRARGHKKVHRRARHREEDVENEDEEEQQQQLQQQQGDARTDVSDQVEEDREEDQSEAKTSEKRSVAQITVGRFAHGSKKDGERVSGQQVSRPLGQDDERVSRQQFSDSERVARQRPIDVRPVEPSRYEAFDEGGSPEDMVRQMSYAAEREARAEASAMDADTGA